MPPKDPDSRRATQRRYQEKNREKILAKRRGNPEVLAQKRQWYLKNKEKISAKSKADYAKDPEKYAKKNKESRAKHRQKRLDYNSNYYQEHREEILAKTGEYQKAHPEQRRASGARWRTAHPEEKKAHQAKYQAKNNTKLVEKLRLRRQAHPEILAAQQHRRRFRKINAPINDLTAAQWLEIQVAFSFRCLYCPPNCWRCSRKKHKLTPDHVTPYARNGSNTVQNVVPDCQSCNSRKSAGEAQLLIQPLLLTIAPSRKKPVEGDTHVI